VRHYGMAQLRPGSLIMTKRDMLILRQSKSIVACHNVKLGHLSLSETYALKYWCSRKGEGGKLILGFRVWASRNRNNYFQKAQVQSDPCRCLLLAQVPMLSAFAFQNSERACGVNLPDWTRGK